jgi:hypothetical protein
MAVSSRIHWLQGYNFFMETVPIPYYIKSNK